MQELIAEMVLGWADDSLILGHRNSEWAGHAPILEEDIAFANLALDELGHARLWYELYQELTGAEPDRLVFFRSAPDWRNTQLVELPKGDWAFSMVRQYLFDLYENMLLKHLVESQEARIAEIAAKIKSEEIYHLRYASNRVKRLGLGTVESHGRMQRAVDELWGFAQQLFVPPEGESVLVRDGIMPALATVRAEWLEHGVQFLGDSGLAVPDAREPAAVSRQVHGEDLNDLLSEMQEVARLEKFGVEW